MSEHPTLSDLDGALPFVERHIGLDADAVTTMLATLGFDSLDALMAGFSHREAARAADLASSTLENYKRRIRKDFGA